VQSRAMFLKSCEEVADGVSAGVFVTRRRYLLDVLKKRIFLLRASAERVFV